MLTGSKHFDDETCHLLSPPFGLGGLNLINPAIHLHNQYLTSRHICSPLINQYFSVFSDFDPVGASVEQQEITSTLASKYTSNLAVLVGD